MNIFIVLTVTVNFFILIHCSTEECPIKTDCIPSNPNAATPIEIGVIYDLSEDSTVNQPVKDLLDISCQVISQFGNSLTFKRYPGASVVAKGHSIKCADDCLRNREDACKGIVDSKYFKNCWQKSVPLDPLVQCLDSYAEPDAILKTNGKLRCNLGIPISKIPALIFNKVYHGCEDIKSADQLKKFLCSTFGEALRGKGC